MIEYPGATPQDIETSRNFGTSIAVGIEGTYDDIWACLSSIFQGYKAFTGGWPWDGNGEIDEKVTLSTSNVGLHSLLYPA